MQLTNQKLSHNYSLKNIILSYGNINYSKNPLKNIYSLSKAEGSDEYNEFKKSLVVFYVFFLLQIYWFFNFGNYFEFLYDWI